MVRVEWQGGFVFEATPPSGVKLVLDSHPESGGQGKGPTPVEALLSAVAACSAIDVISILEKKRQKVTSYRVEIEGTRPPQGQYPRPFLSIVIRHILQGEALDPAAVERAVELSDSKYCSVIATLRQTPAVSSEWRIEA
jgi:putative redox protein